MISSVCNLTVYLKTNMFGKTLINISKNIFYNSNKRTTFINI